MDTAQVIARFEAERQALALMDHQHIAKVLDAGATETGRPYFVMELVAGVPITDYCDRNQLTPKERLELFVPVCNAIQHAHQKGIIHRDIKPSNVLVTLYDGKPVAKVIDFGVAKATDQRLTERTMFTPVRPDHRHARIHEPRAGRDGCARYRHSQRHLFAGRRALRALDRVRRRSSAPSFAQAAYVEILRRIRDDDTPKPSTRLSESKESLATISAQRKMEPARLARLVRGELDWIVMQALEKDRVRRYDTPSALGPRHRALPGRRSGRGRAAVDHVSPPEVRPEVPALALRGRRVCHASRLVDGRQRLAGHPRDARRARRPGRA